MLSSDRVYVKSCLSPTDKLHLLYYERYIRPSIVKNRDIVMIPFCNEVHFTGYIIDVKNRHITLVDSFSWKDGKTKIALRLGEILFGGVNVAFSCFYKSKQQFDSNSCGAWLVAGMSAYLKGLTEVNDQNHAFEICNALLDTPLQKNTKNLSINSNSFPL